MEVANCTVTVSPEHSLPLRDVTPAEALILRTLHFKGSNGSPLSEIEVTGKAVTIVTAARSGQPEYYDPNKGRTIPAVEPVAAVTKPRTNEEEKIRLKRKYTAVIDGMAAFDKVFGTAVSITLPKTFDEISEQLQVPVKGLVVVAPETAPESDSVTTEETPKSKHQPHRRQSAIA